MLVYLGSQSVFCALRVFQLFLPLPFLFCSIAIVSSFSIRVNTAYLQVRTMGKKQLSVALSGVATTFRGGVVLAWILSVYYGYLDDQTLPSILL